jgi:hypothetical protein
MKSLKRNVKEIFNLILKQMKFTYKSQAEIDKMSDAEADTYKEAQRYFEQKQHQDAIDAAVKTTKEEMQVIIDKAKEDITELALQVKEIEAKGGTSSLESELSKELKEKKESIRSIAKGAKEEITVKANTLRASIATNPHDLLIDGIGQLQRVKRSLYDIFRKIPVAKGNHNGTIAYVDWDEATTVKAAAMIAEGAAFPESTAKFKGYTLQLQKIGDTLPVSEEFFEDEMLAAAELDMFLETNVNDVIDTQIVTGDGTGSNLKGLISSTPAYVPVASGITDANIYDLVAKVSESITSVGGAKYNPDFVAMNIADINKLKLKKDTTNNYVFNFNDPRIGSMNIIEDNRVTANTMYVGDSRFARIYEMGGVVLSEGYTGSQFTSDMLTLKARKRMAFLIRTVDQTGFRKVTSISAALVTLAT